MTLALKHASSLGPQQGVSGPAGVVLVPMKAVTALVTVR